MLVYKILEGSIEDPTTLVLSAEACYPMDYGNEVFTSYDSSAEIMFHFLDVFPGVDPIAGDTKVWRVGHIHSHHHMPTFFSGTDDGELKTNGPKFPFYLSLIVAYNQRFTAKIAIAVEETVEVRKTKKSKFYKEDKVENITKTEFSIETVVCDVEYAGSMPAVPEWFLERLGTIAEDYVKKTTVTTPVHGGYNGYSSPSASGSLKVLAPKNFIYVVPFLSEMFSLGLSQRHAYSYAFDDMNTTLSGNQVERYTEAIVKYFNGWRKRQIMGDCDDQELIDCLKYACYIQTSGQWFRDNVWKTKVIPALEKAYGEPKTEPVQGLAVVR